MASRGRTARQGGHTGRVGRPPMNQRQEKEESMHVKYTERVHDTNVTPPGGDNEGALRLEPELRDAIAREVVLTLKSIFPGLLPETHKRKWENASKGTGKGNYTAEAKKPRTEEYEACKKCLRKHQGECLVGSTVCYRCGKAEHYSRECLRDTKCQGCGLFGQLTKNCRRTRQSGSGKEKEQPKARTRAYALTEEEARGNPDDVSGTFLVNDEHVAILFDSGAGKSFISNASSRKLDCTINIIVKAFSVQTVVGKNSAVFQVTEDCIIEIEGHKFPSRLFLLTLGGFEIVLGMDWLAANEAQIICKRKRIHLKAPSGSPIMIYGDWNCTMPNVISMIKAESYMRRGCEAYLAYVIDDRMKTKALKNVPVVCNFPEVFPEDLPGLPPDREIEFSY
ncbi:hypothetical protein L1987_30237 [Smallanthus sonchifolius]|uniref:Uncharacterized protein n=1 Tax=Smallanthus sonchifolius TaxID=185202 RepID=A0ACB9I2W1_9ASTR|nr:hypothetical protein L1987_30237 [Smallanthus sonchifolius]